VDVGTDEFHGPDGAVRAVADGQDDGRAGLAADAADRVVEALALGRLAVDREHDVARVESALLGGAATEDTDDHRQALGRGVDLGADPDVGARQRRPARCPLLGRHELRVAGVADGIGHAVDRGVGELLVVEVLRVDVVLVELLPGLVDQGHLAVR
jgi:hypothetical protein